MSKVRNLPETTTLADNDLLYAVDEAAGPNGGRKITKANLKTSVAPTAAETKAAYESNPNTNAYTDAEKTKLAGIEPGATADQTAAEVPYVNTTSGLSATNVQDAINEVNTKSQADFIPTIVANRILHYSGGTARFDGVFYQLVPNDILLNPSVTNGEVYVDLDGIVKQTASNIPAPPFTIVFAKFSTDLNNIVSLTDERVKNAQNIVRGVVGDITDISAGDGAYEGDTGRIADAGHQHPVLTATAVTLDANSTNTEGSSANLARADHTHDLSTDVPSTQNPDQANAEGTSANLARADHIHNIPADAPITILSPVTTNAEGVGTAFARNDHTHAIATAVAGDLSTVNSGDAAVAGVLNNYARGDHQHPVATGTPSTQNPDQANAEGASTRLARADHVHNIPADAPTTTLSPATTNAEGVGASFARNDHTHAIATALAADITTIQPDDVAAAGTANTFARGDHKHAIVASAPSVNLHPNGTNAEGTSTGFARADHSHAFDTAQAGDLSTINAGDAEVLGTVDRFVKADHQHPVATATAVGLDTTSTSTEGNSTSLARANHTHAIATGAPSTQNADQANAAGVSANFAKADHIHNIPTATAADVGSANAQGSAATFSKSDHVHRGVRSIKANAGTQRFGDTSLVNGNGVTATDDGAGNFTIDTIGGPNELVVTAGSGLSANYTTGKVRFDGTYTAIGAGSIVLTANQVSGRIYVDTDGVVKQTAGGVLAPPYTVVLALFTTGASTITAILDHRTFLDQNIVRGLSGDIVTIVPNASAAQGTTNKLADAGHTHAIATAAAVGLDSTSTSTEGAATSFARSNHTHAIASGAASTQTPDQANAAGSSANFAKADHVHNIATAAAVGLNAGSTSTQGTATTFTRSDHTHAIASGAASTQTPDQANAAGSSANFAKADHVHNIPTATPTTVSTSSTNTQGVAATFARSDHVHNVTITSQEATATADDTTTSATDVLMNSMTITPAAGIYFASWDGSIVNSANGAERTWVSLYLNGVQVSATERSIGTSGGAYSPTTTRAVITTPGAQAVELRWRVAGGTSTVHSRRLTLLRIG